MRWRLKLDEQRFRVRAYVGVGQVCIPVSEAFTTVRTALNQRPSGMRFAVVELANGTIRLTDMLDAQHFDAIRKRPNRESKPSASDTHTRLGWWQEFPSVESAIVAAQLGYFTISQNPDHPRR